MDTLRRTCWAISLEGEICPTLGAFFTIDQVIREDPAGAVVVRAWPGHRNIGRGSCRSALADGVERRSTAVVRGLSVYSRRRPVNFNVIVVVSGEWCDGEQRSVAIHCHRILLMYSGRDGVKLCTRKFVAWGSTSRPGSRGASVTLGHLNKAFGSARIARCPRARELVAQRGGLSAAGRATRGPRLDDRSVHDSPQIRIKTAPSGLESISGCRVPRCVAQNGVPPFRLGILYIFS